MEPPPTRGLGRGFRVVPVARHHGGTPVDDLAHLAVLDVTHLLVHDAHVHGGYRQPDGTELAGRVLPVEHAGNRRHLCLPEHCGERHVGEGTCHGFHGGRECGRRSPRHGAQMETALGNVGKIAHGLPLGRHQEHVRDSLGLEEVEDRGGIEGTRGRQHDRLAKGESGHHLGQTGDVEYGRGAEGRPPIARDCGSCA